MDKPPAVAPGTIPPDWWPRPAAASRLVVAPPRRFWQLDRSEQRVLWITFIGGVASIIIGAAILGMALALGRPVEQRHARGVAGLAVFTALYGVIALYMLLGIARVGRRKNKPDSRILVVVTVAGGSSMLALLLLTWIGVAAGIG